jgi:hypothetical protein
LCLFIFRRRFFLRLPMGDSDSQLGDPSADSKAETNPK